jgi:hypothetical protein
MSDQELLLVRNSELSTWIRCRYKWDWAYNEGLTPKRSAAALRFGSLTHEALAVWYKPGLKRGRKPWLTFKDLYNEQLKELGQFGMYADDDWTDALSLGEEMLRHYVEEYGLDDLIEVIAPEQPFQIDVSDPDTGEYLYTQVGTFDAVIRDKVTKKIGLFEHKTAKAIKTTHLNMDPQAGTYWAFGPDWLRDQGILSKKEDLDFILYNFLRKAKKDTRPRNKAGQYLNKPTKANPKGEVSKSQPPPYFQRELVYRSDEERISVMRRNIAMVREMIAVREGKMEIYKNPTRDCSWDCAFGQSGMCELHEGGDDWEMIRDAEFTFWDPYEGHDLAYDDSDFG